MNTWTLIVGAFLVLMGTSIILKGFGINIPFFRFAFAALVIFIGIRILFPGKSVTCCGGPIQTTGRETMFAESRLEGTDMAGEYSVIFGSSKMDLTKVEIKDKPVSIKLDVVFGGSEIKIDASKPVKISASAVFGGVSLPNGSAAAFGSSAYSTPSYKEGSPAIELEVNAVFGGVEIRQ